jgi:hypothetical protein
MIASFICLFPLFCDVCPRFFVFAMPAGELPGLTNNYADDILWRSSIPTVTKPDNILMPQIKVHLALAVEPSVRLAIGAGGIG